MATAATTAAAEAQAVELIRAAGLDLMANEVAEDPTQLRRTLHNLARNRISGEHGPLFTKALAALGGYRLDAMATRRRIEGGR